MASMSMGFRQLRRAFQLHVHPDTPLRIPVHPTANKMDVLGLLGYLESVQRACATFGTAYPADNSTPYVYKLYKSQCRCFSFTDGGVNVTQRLFQIYVGLLAWKDRVSTATPGSDPCSVSCSRVEELQSAGTP
jgi:hypothetical protein